jgi:DNA replicative helicase MCM subunit Mcm2 (Cdc46/Mcm family)
VLTSARPRTARQTHADHHSFFHPRKDRLLGSAHSLIDQFRDGTGNYAVAGVQRKLNLLLHGPPGTGKSKLVRTLAMYLQRHVVSFTISQVATEVQLITLLDNLKCISDDPKKPDLDMSYEDVIFVIEEIDTDPRGICLQRPDPEEEAEEAASSTVPSRQVSATGPSRQTTGGSEAEAEPARKTKREVVAEKEAKEMEDKAKREPPLSLGLVLRQLDGGSEAPGRVIIMTTNREECLDAAFKRPGRVKKVRLDNLAYNEFKQMVLHFRRSQGSLPTADLWTRPIDDMAQVRPRSPHRPLPPSAALYRPLPPPAALCRPLPPSAALCRLLPPSAAMRALPCAERVDLCLCVRACVRVVRTDAARRLHVAAGAPSLRPGPTRPRPLSGDARGALPRVALAGGALHRAA